MEVVEMRFDRYVDARGVDVACKKCGGVMVV